MLVAAAAAATLGIYAWSSAQREREHTSLAALERTYLDVAGPAPVTAAALARSDGSAFPERGLEGRWTLVFFGFTSCPDVCPTTLQALSAVAREAASGVDQGSTQILFVSVDPDRDTPERLRAYLGNFDARIVGLRGDALAVRRFVEAVGAGFDAAPAGFDHSTSLFVLDPRARLAGVLLRPAEPARIVADLATLKSAHAPATARAD